MKYSAHCCITNAVSNKYPYVESIKSFLAVCDEVVVIDGGSVDNSVDNLIKELTIEETERCHIFGPGLLGGAPKWEQDWSWHQFGVSMNFGFEKCTGDVVIKFDADYIFDEGTVEQFKRHIDAWMNDKIAHPIPPMAFSLQKVNLMTVNYAFKKARPALVVNKRDYPALRYGMAYKEDPDFVYAIMPFTSSNAELVGDHPLYYGRSIMEYPAFIQDTPGTVWVYDFAFMDAETMERVSIRSALAKARSKEAMLPDKRKQIISQYALEAVRKFIRNRGESYWFTKTPLAQHPRAIRDKVEHITIDMFGYDCFGWLEGIKLNIQE